MTSNFSELRLDRVTRRFGSSGSGNAGPHFTALDALSITIRRGEFIALLGPSGCGKSTALNCIAGLLPVSDGGIWLDDTRIDILPPERRGFGMVFQNYALFPHMSVERNVGFGLAMRGVSGVESAQRVKRALDLVQLNAHAKKLPGQLSGGQQQRVAIARAIVIEPPLVLMDEPLSNLDAKLRLEMRAEIRRIHRELGRSTIYVTHDQDEALSLADRVVVMKDGVAQQIAPPHAIYGEPANLHVARFMGYRNLLPMNVRGMAGTAATLEADGFTLEARAMQPLDGGRALVAMRPDEFEIVGTPGPNTFSAQVGNVEYCGRDNIVDVRTASGIALIVRTEAPLRTGESVLLAIPRDKALAYPDDAAA
ncbi:ABC transporter ATP-binding protein [Variovorax sp. PBL-E5]|uniref:ABC transporter ATP-binding protein n=1 Tax=Variovorax sp. PBL-E5 TaxID=434014 RepID=UPI001318739C|nr:ABC transporter ATP-binding protein [Variovorax sp. PBL-E5]VTU15980.1 sn-glycerol-3-phosphate import ATP-binding protein UgpC [Variovorax sp. PBL-E5]